MKRKTIDSMSTDPTNSNSSHCAWIIIENDELVEVGDELGREGGILWAKSFPNRSNSTLKSALRSIARDWPNLFEIAKRHSPIEITDTVAGIKRTDLLYKRRCLKYDIDILVKQLNRKRGEFEDINYEIQKLNTPETIKLKEEMMELLKIKNIKRWNNE